MTRNATLAFMVLTVFSSCHRYYTSATFDQRTAKHHSIAILPPEMILTGVQPRNLSQQDIAQLEETESRVFQESLYNNILKKSNRGKYGMHVVVQPSVNTLAILEKNHISVRESWSRDDRDLARVLGVDAVVRTTIHKERYMSDLASFGVGAGRKIANILLDKPPLVGVRIDKTNDITASCEIVSNGETLWSDDYKRASDWSSPANNIIDRITGKFAKHFPYRQKS